MEHLAMCLGVSADKLTQRNDCIVEDSNGKCIIIPTILFEEKDLEILRKKAKDTIDSLINHLTN